jgi:hypothetical protein
MLNRPRHLLACAISILLLPFVALGTESGGYRLAGIVAAGSDYLAILELPDGRQQLVRTGTAVDGGGRVAKIDAHSLRLQISGRTLNLALDGSGEAPVVPAGLGVVQEQSEFDNEMIRRVDADAFSDAVGRANNAAAPAAGAPTPGKRSDAAAEAGRRLAPVLNLPPDSRVTAVNELPVHSAEQAIRLIEDSLQAGVSPRLNIEHAGGASRVYMSPERSGEPNSP